MLGNLMARFAPWSGLVVGFLVLGLCILCFCGCSALLPQVPEVVGVPK